MMRLPTIPFSFSKKKIAILLVIVAVIGVLFSLYQHKKAKQAAASSGYTTVQAETRDIVSRLNASAPLQPADSYTITTLVDGTVLSTAAEDGGKVTKGQLLYQINGKLSASSIIAAENSLEQAKTRYGRLLDSKGRLLITSQSKGLVSQVSVKKGEQINPGQELARVENREQVKLIVPFPSDDAVKFYIGQSAQVTLDGSFETLNGSVSKISGVDEVLSGNRIVRNVTITVNNPGGIGTQQAASASVNGVGSSGNGKMESVDLQIITSDIAGKVVDIPGSVGTRVSEGTPIIRLSSVSLSDDIQNAASSLKAAQQDLASQKSQYDREKGNLTIFSPISGTIVERTAKTGDNVTSGKALCTIYDLSSLNFIMNVDELDLQKVQVGQAVSITANAVEGKSYQGLVTRIGIKGTSANGITTYPVTVLISDTQGLLPGMNIKAEITSQKAEGVLSLPKAAIQRGNLVMISKSSPSAKNATNDPAPEGYVYVSVATGLSDSEYVEIKQGLTKDDLVAYEPPSAAPAVDGKEAAGGF